MNYANKIRAYVGRNDIDFKNEVNIKLTHEGYEISLWEITTHSKPSLEQLDALETEANVIEQELETAKANEEQAKADAKVSGNQKLLDLGLTQAEATALTGYTPPTEA